MDEDKHSGSDGPGAKGKKPTVVALPQKREVSEQHLANLRTSALTDDTIAAAQLYTEINPRALALLMQRKSWFRSCGAALVFPFYLPDATQPHAYRVRPSHPRTVKTKGRTRTVKYDQAEAHGSLVYYTPRARAERWYADAGRTLYWTEGEKKALVFDQLGLACVGLTGVWNWSDAKHRADTREDRLHPTVREHVVIAGRAHVICYDADAKDNEQVMLAAARLCGVLRAAGAMDVRFVCPPSPDTKGIDEFFAAFGEDVTRRLLDSAAPIEPIDPKNPLQRVTTLHAMRGAPVTDDMRVPEGYEILKDGTLWRLAVDDRHSDVKVARGVILLQRFLHDRYTQEGRVEICFVRDGGWVSQCVERRAIADSRTMISELASYGAPVTSNSAPKLVDWIEDLHRANVGRIAHETCVARAGWHRIDDTRAFVLNEAVFADETAAQTLVLDTRGDRKKMFAALKARGSLQQHIVFLRRACAADPVCAAMVFGALAATLLEPLGAANFAIHLPGDSSRGKTSMLKIAASVFGDPNDEHWVASWNITAVAAELRAASLPDLPQCYDEVGASDAQTIERLVYMLINGGGRARGQKDLTLRETPNWRTVVLSTGERELADQTTATGAQIRVIHLPVAGFGHLSALEVDELREGCVNHAGSFGRLWIEKLLTIDDWEPHRESLRVITKHLRATAADPLEARVAGYFALLVMAEALAAQIGLGELDGGMMRRLFGDQSKREVVRALADRSLALARDWVLSEPDAFPELVEWDTGEELPRRGAARTLHGFRKPDVTLFIQAEFRKFCETHRISSREVLREWAGRGWLLHEPGRLDKDVRIGRDKQRFYVLRHEGSAE